MLTDKNLRISDTQAVTNAAVLSTDKIDLTVNRDIGEGKTLYMVFNIVENFAAGTSINFEAITADDAALTSNIVVLGSTGATVTAALTSANCYAVPLSPMIGNTGKRYLGARYTPVGVFNAGKVTTDIAETIQDGKKFYKSGFTV